MRQRLAPAPAPAAEAETETICSRWRSLLVLLALIHAATSALPTDHAGTKMVLSEPPRIKGATSSTLVVEADAEWCSGCIAVWEIKEQNNESTWRNTGSQPVGHEHIISDLLPGKTYAVRALLEHGRDHEPMHTEGAPVAHATTCHDQPKKPKYIWTDERSTNSLTVGWMTSDDDCVSNRFYISWKMYVTEESSSEDHLHLPPSCPPNSTFLGNKTTLVCEDYSEQYCFTADHLTPATRYLFQVWTVDWLGRCSAPITYQTATIIKFWGNITVGLWILIIISVLLLVAAIAALVIFIRRKAARKATEGSVAFSRDLRNGEAHGNEHEYPEPVTRIEK